MVLGMGIDIVEVVRPACGSGVLKRTTSQDRSSLSSRLNPPGLVVAPDPTQTFNSKNFVGAIRAPENRCEPSQESFFARRRVLLEPSEEQ